MMPGPVTVFHTRRNPWDVIDSLANRNRIVNDDCATSTVVRSLREVMNALCPSVARYSDPINRAAEFMLRWNESIEAAIAESPQVVDSMSYAVERLTSQAVRRMLALVGESRDDGAIEYALDPALHQTNRGRVVTKNVGSDGLSNPVVAKFIKEYCNGQVTSYQRVEFTDQRLTASDLSSRLEPELLAEVNEYARRFGYKTITEALVA
jgi:hypothetical protein